MEKENWKRPQDVETYRTSDPKVMLGKYLPKNVLKTWSEDFMDEDTKETVSIDRVEIVVQRGYIDQGKLQEIMFAIQSGDIEDVEICDDDVADMTLYTPGYLTLYNVELPQPAQKMHYVTFAQTIPQAILIAAEFGQMYRNLHGWVKASRVVTLDAYVVPDDHKCIPDECRKPAFEPKDYFRVTVRSEWTEDMKLKKADCDYIIAANDVGQAKERIALMLDIEKAEMKAKGTWTDEDEIKKVTIRKAVPFDVDCIVPREFSELYKEQATL